MAERNFAFKLSLGTQQFVAGLQGMAKKMQSTFEGAGAQIQKKLGESVPSLQADPKKLLNYSVGGVNTEKSKLSEKKIGKMLSLPEGFQSNEKEQKFLDALKAEISEINKTRINPETNLEGIYEFQDSIDKAKLNLKELKDYLSGMHPKVDFSEFGVQLDDILGDTKAKAAEMENHLQKALPFHSLERFKANFKRSIGGLRDGFKMFGKDLKTANSIGEYTNAFARLGFTGAKALKSLSHPYAMAIAAAITAVAAVKKLCKEFEKLEQQSARANRAFRMGGRMQGVGAERYKQKAADIAEEGNYTQENVLGGIASARQNAWSLDTKSFDEAVDLAKDVAAVMGTDYARALEKTTALLHAENVSIEDLADVGVVLNRNEAQHLATLQGVWKADERRLFIAKKIGEANKGAAKEQAQTLSGQYNQFSNHIKDMIAKLGEILAPIMKTVMGIANNVMKAGKAILAPFLELGKILMDLLGPVFAGIVFQVKAVAEVAVFILKPLTEILKIVRNILKFVKSWTMGKLQSAWESAKKKAAEYWDYIKKRANEWKEKAREGIINFVGEKNYNKVLDVYKKIRSVALGKTDEKESSDSYVDPRQKFNIQFEDANSMNRRIQTSLLEKNSPAVRQVDLLTRIYDVVSSGQNDRKKESKEQISELREVKKAAKESKVGFAQ